LALKYDYGPGGEKFRKLGRQGGWLTLP